MMRVYCCQLDIVWEDKAANHRRVLGLLEKNKPEPGSLVLLPEMFATGFSMDVPKISESAAAESTHFLQQTARKFDIFLLGGIVTTGPDGKGRNESIVCQPDGTLAVRYAKLHPFTLSGEAGHYGAGERLELFDWQGIRTAPLICYDLRFPEAFRAAVRGGAQLYCVTANWPHPRHEHWPALLRARAIENQAYVAGVNRCGTDPKYVYSGRSQIIDPHGNVLADAGEGEGMISAPIDLQDLLDYRARFPALNDMRRDTL